MTTIASSIDGGTDITFSEDVDARFRSLGWHTVSVDGHDRSAVAVATRRLWEQRTGRP